MKKTQQIRDFLDFYFQTRKSQYLKKEIPQHEVLIRQGVLYEVESNTEVLEIERNSIALQEIVLEVAEDKLKKKLPLGISEAFKFIDEFDKELKKEYDCERVINSFSTIIRGLRGYSLYVLRKQGLDIKSFLLSISEDNRENHLYSLESSFFNFLPFFDYSEKEIFETLQNLWQNDRTRGDVITGLRKLPSKNIEKSKDLLAYAYKNNMPSCFISDLLIGLYNAGETSIIEKIVELKNKDVLACLGVLGSIRYNNEQDVEKAFNQIEELEFENIEIANQQSYLIRNIIENEYTTEIIRKNAFKLYVKFLKNGTNEVINRVFKGIYFIKEYEAEKYNLLHLYLSKTGNFEVIKWFFDYFNNPAYIFDIMMRLFNTTPNYRFSMSLFENGIRHGWNTNQAKTEQHILNLFKQHPALGILGVKTIFTAYLGIFHVDLLKLDKAEYQINAIDSICKHPHSFDKLLPLIIPLRNSKLKGVREHLQNSLAYLVFKSYHSTLYNQIKGDLGNNKKDKQFIEPIKKALDNYNKLKELKESIDDLNPYQNERHLMDLYRRLEHETQAKMMQEVNQGKGSFLEVAKNTIIVRGNSWMIREGEISPLGKVESSILIDGNSYLNPDLYEHNLNTI
ncbi:MAG: hypothetical protein ACR2MS_06420 [Weeksellaceae bacterium]